MTLKNNRAPLLCYSKLCALFWSHWWIETGVTVRKHPIWVKIDDFFSCVTLLFDWWPWKIIGHLFYTYFKFCASFCSHWWIQIGVMVWKRPIWVKFDNFWSRVTLKFDGWPWKTIGHLQASSRFVHHFIAICEFKLELWSGNAWVESWPLWKFQDDMMTGTLSKRYDGGTDRRTNRRTDRWK